MPAASNCAFCAIVKAPEPAFPVLEDEDTVAFLDHRPVFPGHALLVPHLHVHVVPRRRGDGLRGFFWPRQKYSGADAMREVQQKVRAAVERLQGGAA